MFIPATRNWFRAMPDNAQAVRERMISDLVASERQLRQAAEKVLAEFRELLYYLAGQLAGEQVQEIKRRDPATFQSWTSAQWRAFFDGVLKGHSPWTSASPERTREQVARLEAENERLRQAANTWQQQRRALEGQIQALNEHVAILESQLAHAQRLPIGVAHPVGAVREPQCFARVDPQSGIHAEILKALRKWNVPTRPARFARLLSKEELQWRRQSMALFLLARYGLNARVEQEHLIGIADGLKSRSSALRRSIDLLIDNGVLVAESLHLLIPETSLALVRLSDEGCDLCQVLGWEPRESDWERLLRLRPGEKKSDRSLAILILAMHARLRGWQVEVLPEVAEPNLQPDILLQRDAERVMALVALGDEIKTDQWQALAALQDRVALLTRTILQRQRLASEIKSLSLSGLATSLEELIGVRLQDITPGDDLWKYRWDSGQPPDEKDESLSPLPAGS